MRFLAALLAPLLFFIGLVWTTDIVTPAWEPLFLANLVLPPGYEFNSTFFQRVVIPAT